MSSETVIEICKNIPDEKYSEKEKALAVYKMLLTRNVKYITKVDLCEIIEWLWNKSFEMEVKK